MPVGTLENLARSAFVRTPPVLAERIVRNLLVFPEGRAANVLDPTAGEGDLLVPCRDIPLARLYGVEISAERAERARTRLPRAEIVACALEGVSIPKASMSLVLANPPYFFQDGKRAEYRIIADAGTLLIPGGIMVAIIPARSAWDGTMVNHWCRWYERVQVWKFPDRASSEDKHDDEGAFTDYTQICVIGIRRAEPLDPMPAEQRRLSAFRYHVVPANAKPSARLRAGWEGGSPPPELPTEPDLAAYAVPEARSRSQIIVRHADEALLLAALERQGAHLSAAWEQATTWEQDEWRGQPVMPLSGEAHVAAEVLTGLLDGEIICGPGTGDGPEAQPHLLTAFVGREWVAMSIDAEEREKMREHGVVEVSMRQYQDKPILGILNLATGEIRYEQGEAVFSFLAPWLGQLAARVVERRQPRYRLDPAEWELRVVSQFGQDKQLPNAAFPGLSAAQQHRVYAMGRALDETGRVAIQGEPGVGKTRLTTAVAARMAYQWRQRNGPLFLGQARQPAWMAGLRRAWFKNPRTLALLGLAPEREAETGRIIAYRRTDGTCIAPEDAGPQALPVLVATPKKVTKEFGNEIVAAWRESGAEVMQIESHRDIPVWFKRCAESAAPAVIGIVPHSLTRAFGREWQPALIEKQVTREEPVQNPEPHLLPRLVEVFDEHHILTGYRWKVSGQLYTKPVSEPHFFCPGCGGLIRAIPGKLHEVERKADHDEEMSGLQALLSATSPEAILDADRAVPVTSRTYFTLKPRWCHCPTDARNATPDGSIRVRTPLWTNARRVEAQRKHPQLGFASWSEAVRRVQLHAHTSAGAVSPKECAAILPLSQQVRIALADPDAAAAMLALVSPLAQEITQGAAERSTVLRQIVFCPHEDGAALDALAARLAALHERLAQAIVQAIRREPHQETILAISDLALPLVNLEPRIFRDLWHTAYPHKPRNGKANEPQASSLERQAVSASSTRAPQTRAKATSPAEMMLDERRRSLTASSRQLANEQYQRFQPLPDSFSPYEYLYRFYRGCVALAIIDESHNGRGRDTDIAHAFHQAMLSAQTRLFSTGTHYGGNVLDFYHYWFRFHPPFWQRLGLGWNDADKALERYGVVQEWSKEYESDARRGSGQTNIQVSTIPAPGLSAKLIPSLLEDLCYLTVLDVGAHMPPRIEFPEIVSMRDPAIETAQQATTEAREQARRALDEYAQRLRREKVMPTSEQRAEKERLEAAYGVAARQASDLVQQQSSYHLAKHYGTLVGRLEDLAKERNQAARLAKGTVPRWFAVLPCDAPFEVWQTKRGDWGDETDRTLVVSTPTLAWDYLYPLEKRLIALVERERAEGRRIMIYYEQNDLRSMAKRLCWVLQDFHPWTLPNKVASEDRQAAILDAVLKTGHGVILVPYRRVNEGLNLQSAVDTILWYEMAMNLFMLDQASRRAWRLGKREEVRIYYLTYAHTTGHSKLRRLGLQSGAAAAFAGEPARGALIHEAGADQTTLARLSSMLEADVDDSLPQAMAGESEIAQEEVTLKAVFRRRAEELQATLKAGRQFLGGIEDTLEARIAALLGNPAFAAPVWADLPVHCLLVTPRHRHQPEPEQAPRIVHMEPHSRMPDPSISDPVPSTVAAEPQPPSLVAPTPTPVPLPAPTQTWVFGDQAHILLARRRAPHKQCGAVAHPKRRIPMIEREIPAFDEQAAIPANGSSRTASSVALPSLWDMLTAPTSLAAHTAAPFPPLPAPRPPSTPQQTGLWD